MFTQLPLRFTVRPPVDDHAFCRGCCGGSCSTFVHRGLEGRSEKFGVVEHAPGLVPEAGAVLEWGVIGLGEDDHGGDRADARFDVEVAVPAVSSGALWHFAANPD